MSEERLISADALKSRVNLSDEDIAAQIRASVNNPKYWGLAIAAVKGARMGFMMDIDDEPTVEAEPVIHAEWELIQELPFADEYACTRCGRSISLSPGKHLRDFPYCHCGAKMDEEASGNGS